MEDKDSKIVQIQILDFMKVKVSLFKIAEVKIHLTITKAKNVIK